MIHFHMQRFNSIDFMVIELRFFKNNKKMKNMGQNVKSTFCDIRMSYVTDQPIFVGYFSHILHLDIIKSEINFKLKVKGSTDKIL